MFRPSTTQPALRVQAVLLRLFMQASLPNIYFMVLIACLRP